MALSLSVIKRFRQGERGPGEQILRMQDGGFSLKETSDRWALLVDAEDRDSPVRVLVGRGPTGATIVVPANTATKGFLNNFGKLLDINIKRPPGDRKIKEQPKETNKFGDNVID